EESTMPTNSTSSFSYSDWISGYANDTTDWYGRPWTVVYGSLSEYPSATLNFALDATPGGPATLEVTGLDDEWSGNNRINLTVNGTSIFQGENPWLSYTGSAEDFSDAPWTMKSFDIPAGVLQAGQNDIVLANLEPYDNFGTPPYVLLSDTALNIGVMFELVEPASIASLPDAVPVPNGMVLENRGSLSADAITAAFTDPAIASRFFDEWGWQENQFAHFAATNGATPSGLAYVDIGVHRFANTDGASAALDYFCDVRRDQMSLGDVKITPVGDETRAIIGSALGGTEASVYSRRGLVVTRVSVLSYGADPLAEALAVTQNLIANLG
ncbi:MAG: hypothetical protein AB7V46_12650, partial [Thermomicrobiales bacterium]